MHNSRKRAEKETFASLNRGQIDNGRVGGDNMDCGTCETAPTVEIIQPKVVDVSLTMTDKAIEMLTDAFGDDRSHALLVGVLSGGCSGYMYDLQIVESTDIDCQELEISGFRVCTKRIFPSARRNRSGLCRSAHGWWVQDKQPERLKFMRLWRIFCLRNRYGHHST